MSALEIGQNLGSLETIESKQEDLRKKRKEILKDLSKIEDEAFKAGLRFQKNVRNEGRPQVDGSDPNHIDESEFHQKKKIKLNEGMTPSGVNKKLHSAISIVSSGRSNQDERSGESEFKIEKRELTKKVPDDLQKRNRNLFGNMLGYLNKAKTTLENQKERLKKQDEFIHQAESKNIEEASKLKEKHKHILETKREELLKEKKAVEKEMLTCDHDRLIKMTEKHFSDISGYIITSQLPPIMWKPVTSKSETERLILESQPIINKLKESALDFVSKSVSLSEEQLESEQFANQHDEQKEEKGPEETEKSKVEEDKDDRSKSSNDSDESDRD